MASKLVYSSDGQYFNVSSVRLHNDSAMLYDLRRCHVVAAKVKLAGAPTTVIPSSSSRDVQPLLNDDRRTPRYRVVCKTLCLLPLACSFFIYY